MVYWFIDINKSYNYTVCRGKEPGLRKNASRENDSTGRAIIGAFIAALVIKIFIIDFMIAEGHSMAPVIKPGTIIMVCKTWYGLRFPGSIKYLIQWSTPRVGDVVVFYTPHGDIAVKRCGEILQGDEFLALGDNSSNSFDSRSYGPVPFNSIIGKVLGKK
jgi:signal peptidase I